MKELVRPINELVNELAPGQLVEVRDFVEFLLAKRRSSARLKPRFDWAGALKDMRGEYTSVDLQHEITHLRGREE